MSKVFIPNVPTRYDAIVRGRIPKLDLTDAMRFGEFRVMISELKEPDMQVCSGFIQKIIQQELNERDMIAIVGNGVLVSAALHYATLKHGKVLTLQWNRREHKYEKKEIVL